MELLVALGQILVRAIPTFLLVWILYVYTVRVFHRPLQDALRKRYEATGKLREESEANLATAERKAAEYQEALRAAGTELYRQQEQERQKALEQRASLLRQARQQAEERVGQARQQIHEEEEEAKKLLVAESEQMARSITEVLLKPAALASSPGSFLGGSEAIQ